MYMYYYTFLNGLSWYENSANLPRDQTLFYWNKKMYNWCIESDIECIVTSQPHLNQPSTLMKTYTTLLYNINL